MTAALRRRRAALRAPDLFDWDARRRADALDAEVLTAAERYVLYAGEEGTGGRRRALDRAVRARWRARNATPITR